MSRLSKVAIIILCFVLTFPWKVVAQDRAIGGGLTVDVDGNLKVTGGGGGTQYNQGTAATSTDTMTMAGCVRADTAAVDAGVVDGDRVRCIVDSTGRLWVNVGNTVTITGTVTVTDGAGALNVIVDSGTLTANQGGTWTVQPGNTANTTAWKVDGSAVTQPIAGDVAHDGVDSGNPVKIGGQAATALPTAVANADRVNALYDKFGRAVVLLQAPRDLITTNTITLSSTTETTLLTAVASVFLDLTHLKCTNTSATLVRVDIRDATAGTVRDSIALAASGGGFTDNYTIPIPQTTVNNNWTAQLSAAVTDVRCTARAVQNK